MRISSVVKDEVQVGLSLFRGLGARGLSDLTSLYHGVTALRLPHDKRARDETFHGHWFGERPTRWRDDAIDGAAYIYHQQQRQNADITDVTTNGRMAQRTSYVETSIGCGDEQGQCG